MRQSLIFFLCLVPPWLSAGPEEVLRQAETLRQQRQWKEAAALIAAQDVGSWPEPKRLEAWQTKGQCESFAKLGAEAEATFRQAIALRPGHPDLWVALGDNYQLNLPGRSGDAMAAYREAMRLAGDGMGWQRFSAAVSLARVLTDEVMTGEALTVLQPFEKMTTVPASWQIRILRARGHALAAAGRDAEALAQFREALALENPTKPPAAR